MFVSQNHPGDKPLGKAEGVDGLVELRWEEPSYCGQNHCTGWGAGLNKKDPLPSFWLQMQWYQQLKLQLPWLLHMTDYTQLPNYKTQWTLPSSSSCFCLGSYHSNEEGRSHTSAPLPFLQAPVLHLGHHSTSSHFKTAVSSKETLLPSPVCWDEGVESMAGRALSRPLLSMDLLTAGECGFQLHSKWSGLKQDVKSELKLCWHKL